MSNKDYPEWRWLLTNAENSKRFFPTSAMVIKAITSQPQTFEEDDLSEEIAADDYDDWVYQAFLDLVKNPQCFHSCVDNSALIECPRMRLLRIGEEAERNGKPSALFRHLMELTNNGEALPHVTKRAMSVAQKYLNVAIAFKQFADANRHEYTNFRDLERLTKWEWKRITHCLT